MNKSLIITKDWIINVKNIVVILEEQGRFQINTTTNTITVEKNVIEDILKHEDFREVVTTNWGHVYIQQSFINDVQRVSQTSGAINTAIYVNGTGRTFTCREELEELQETLFGKRS